MKFVPSMSIADVTEKKEARSKLLKEDVTVYLTKFDTLIEKSGTPGHSIGSSLSAADFYVFAFVDMMKCGQYEHVPAEYVDQFKNIMQVYNTVATLPNVQTTKAKEDESMWIC